MIKYTFMTVPSIYLFANTDKAKQKTLEVFIERISSSKHFEYISIENLEKIFKEYLDTEVDILADRYKKVNNLINDINIVEINNYFHYIDNFIYKFKLYTFDKVIEICNNKLHRYNDYMNSKITKDTLICSNFLSRKNLVVIDRDAELILFSNSIL